MSRVIQGHVKTGRDAALIFATDGSVAKRKHQGQWQTGGGWISTHGHYGAIWTPQPDVLAGRDRATVAELRAIAHAVGGRLPDGPVTVLVDSRSAAGFVRRWKAGDLAMPSGYLGTQQPGRRPTIHLFAETVSEHPGNLCVRWVPSHSGIPLNEAADALAHLGCRQVRDRLPAADVARRARGLAEAFLADPGCLVVPDRSLRGVAA